MSEEDNIVTLDELIKADDEAGALIYGGISDDGDKCSYPRGYVKRQAIYSCKTCYENTGQLAGLCYRCSVHCHADHEVLSLYTKRNFRCDCGTSKFGGFSLCQLCEDKEPCNSNNKYNHNFEGLYCTCSRPYPDPDRNVEEHMYQCCICEDWYHLEHIGLHKDFRVGNDFQELICTDCVKENSFFWLFYYSQMKISGKLDESQSEGISEPKRVRLDVDSSGPAFTNKSLIEESVASKVENSCHCRIPKVLASCGVETLNVSNEALAQLPVKGLSFPSPIFWRNNWRVETMCRCHSCESMLKSKGLEFILDPDDALDSYMEVGLKRFNARHEEEQKAFSRFLMEIPRPQAIAFASHVNRFKNALAEFLEKQSVDTVITEQAVKKFLADLKKDI